jgi:hypothetical protein
VDGEGDELLARPGLARDEHRQIGRREPLELGEELPHAGRGPDHGPELLARRELYPLRAPWFEAQHRVAATHLGGLGEQRVEHAEIADERSVR